VRGAAVAPILFLLMILIGSVGGACHGQDTLILPETEFAGLTGTARFQKGASPTNIVAFANSSKNWQTLPDVGVNFGIVTEPIWLRFSARNDKPEKIEWIFALNRTAFEQVDIYKIGADGVAEQLLGSNDRDAFMEIIQQYSTVAIPFELKAKEEALILVRYVSATSSSLRPELVPLAEFRSFQTRKHLFYVALTASIFSLILYNFIANSLISLKETIYASLGQLFGFLYYSQELGMLSLYFAAGNLRLGLYSSPILLSGMLLWMLMFARAILAVPSNMRSLAKFWNFCIFLMVLTSIWDISAYYNILPWSKHILLAEYIIGAPIIVSLFLASLYATIFIKKSYWPLAFGWGAFSVTFISYGILVGGYLARDPYISGLYMITFYLDIFALSMALSYRVSDIKKSRFLAERRAREAAEQRAQVYEDLSDKSRLIMSLGHDSMQAVHALKLAVASIETNKALANHRDTLNVIRSATAHLGDVLSTGMDNAYGASNLQNTLCLSEISWAHLTKSVDLIFSAEAKASGLELVFLGSENHKLVCDKALLMRVLANLVSNAIKFSENGRIAVILRPAGKSIRIQVRDSGCGMTSEELKATECGSLAIKNQTSDYEGYGVGIAVCRRILADLKGSLTFRSAPKKGTNALVVLPDFCSSTAAAPRDLNIVDVDEFFERKENGFSENSHSSVLIYKTADRSMEQRLRLSAQVCLILYKPVNLAVLSAAHFYAGLASSKAVERGAGQQSYSLDRPQVQ